jgi:hypothetical protein
MSQVILTQQSAPVNTPGGGQLALYGDNATFPRAITMDDSGNPSVLLNGQMQSSVAQATGFASDTYLVGSGHTIPVAGKWRAGSIYRCKFEMAKTAAGIAAFTVNLRMGTLGTTSDASIVSLAFAAGTAAADEGIFELLANFRSIGSGTAAVVSALIWCSHHLAATGLISTGASGFGLIKATSSGFNSTTQTKIGISVNGGASFAGTSDLTQSILSL